MSFQKILFLPRGQCEKTLLLFNEKVFQSRWSAEKTIDNNWSLSGKNCFQEKQLADKLFSLKI